VAKRGIRTPRGNRIDKKYFYRMLNNRAYIGEAVHNGESYPGEHDAIIDRATWDRVHAILQESPRKRVMRTRAETPALLKGLLFGPDGAAFSPTHTRKGDRLYRYYVSQTVLKHGAGSCPVGRVPASEIEVAVIDQLRAVFRQPEIVAGTWKAARAHPEDITEADARAALQQLDPLWDELFPAEQARIVALLVERVDIGTDASTYGFASTASAASPARCWPAITRPQHDTRGSHPRHRDTPRPFPRLETRRPEGDADARKRYATAPDRQRARQAAGARFPLEEDAGVGRVRHHRRTGRARRDRALIHDPRSASDPARARNRRGDPGRAAGTGGDAGAGAEAVPRGLGAAGGPLRECWLKRPFASGATIGRVEPNAVTVSNGRERLL
jgi:hypothetical protein